SDKPGPVLGGAWPGGQRGRATSFGGRSGPQSPGGAVSCGGFSPACMHSVLATDIGVGTLHSTSSRSRRWRQRFTAAVAASDPYHSFRSVDSGLSYAGDGVAAPLRLRATTRVLFSAALAAAVLAVPTTAAAVPGSSLEAPIEVTAISDVPAAAV